MGKLQKSDWKLAFILVVQVAGLIEIWILQSWASACYQNSQGQMDMIKLAIEIGLLCTLVVLLLSSVGLSLRNAIARALCEICRSMSWTSPMNERENSFFNVLDLKKGVRFLAFVDLFFLAFCVAQTGGSKVSFYSPFLLSVVSTIAVVKTYSRKELLLWIATTVFIFVLTWTFFFPEEVMQGKEHELSWYLLISLLTCWIFPLLFFVLDREVPKVPKLPRNDTNVTTT